MKLKQKMILEKYKPILDTIYVDKSAFELSVFEDMKIEDMSLEEVERFEQLEQFSF